MTATPFFDLSVQLHRSALRAERCHLDFDIARAVASNPYIMAAIAAEAAKETSLCLVSSPTKSGSKLEDIGYGIELTALNGASPGMIEQHVPAASEALALREALRMTRQKKRDKR